MYIRKTDKSRRKLPIKSFIVSGLVVLLFVSAIFAVRKYLQIKDIYNTRINRLGDLEEQHIDPSSLSLDLLCFEINNGEVARMSNLTLTRMNQWELYIPHGVYISDGEGGYFSVDKLYAAGERLKSGKSGVEYVKERIDDVFGVEIDGYVAITRNVSEVSPCSYLFSHLTGRNLVMHTASVKNLLEDTFSNIDVRGLFAIAKSPRISKMEIGTIDPNRCDVIDYRGETIKVLSEKCIDDVIRGFSAPVVINIEQVRIDVYNATGINRLASQMARRLKNSGLQVARVEDAPKYEEKTQLYVTKGTSFFNTLNVIKDQLGPVSIEINYSATPFVSTGDVVVVLGKDMTKFLVSE